MKIFPLHGWQYWVIFFFLGIIPIASNFNKYYFAKSYDYLVEVACDPQVEICFFRDCSLPDECPPNGISDYKKLYVKAYDFNKCSDNSCEEECASGLIKCTSVECGQSAEDVCSILPITQ